MAGTWANFQRAAGFAPWRTHLHAGLIAAVLLMAVVLPARAITILRDPDIEHALNQLALPLINAAGLNPSSIQILVVQDSKASR